MSSVYTPAFNRIRALLYPIIVNLLGEYIAMDTMEIGKEIKKIKEKEEKKDFELVDFKWLSDYSYQINSVLVDMVRHCIVDEVRGGYELTSYGWKLAENPKEMEELVKRIK
ncbi:MAG: hypothetical protein GF370_02250 [Candidatus Nealsonbacteria bacterium]|nr:hypothetical protein [Candidatus Nealsonbacteria bacterium]